uniref:Caspase recruitment domain family, member 19 n=1 Tax=Periophthalmus magnuspinnatus TaxID=409849 RepID=A0A3B4AJH3_9GOBI
MAVSHFFGLDPAGYRRQLLTDAHFLCSHRRMDSEMLEKLVLQLNRTYPQILSDQEAQKLRNVRVLTKLRCAELLRNLHCKGEEVCKEFYRGIQIHAEDMYCRLPSRVRYRGPVFFLSCFSLVVGVAILYYYRGKTQNTLNSVCGLGAYFCLVSDVGNSRSTQTDSMRSCASQQFTIGNKCSVVYVLASLSVLHFLIFSSSKTKFF